MSWLMLVLQFGREPNTVKYNLEIYPWLCCFSSQLSENTQDLYD